ncbi:MAG TPA: transglycosylase domain-containing protein [Actinomycetota bacterium]|nr:transglycosylase domain-containing protein [Actinomycetota bacterium]
MAWSYRKETTWSSLPLPHQGIEAGGWFWSVLAFLANLPLLGTILALLVLLVLGGIIAAGIVLYVLLGPVPVPKQLPSASVASSKVFAADGSLVATWHGAINREPVPLDRISPYLPKAVVAEEDARFYSEPGVDLRSILRAAVTDLKQGRIVEGGSTITQQYVKDAYVGDKPTLTRKLLEARVAIELTRKLTKNQIMDDYLNTAYFGDGAYGAQAAAETYFGEQASQLTLSQAALLAGIIHSPDADAPTTNAAAANTDRLRVLGRMQKLHQVSATEADQARASATVLATPVPANANYAWFLDALRTSMLAQYGAQRVYGGGLQIHTTLDPAMQAAAQASIQAVLSSPSDPDSSLVAIDPATGYVRAIVGGKDYSASQFNVATLGRRQPGSAFKPFVLAAALEQGISPLAVYNGPSRLCPKGWNPGCVSNFGGESFGSINLLNATVNSVNTVYAQLILQVGAQNVVNIAHKMGIPAPADVVPPQVGCRPAGTPVCQSFLPAVPSLALGSAGVTPLEMASAYATLADNGVYHAPTLVTSVTRGASVLANGPAGGVQALPPSIASEETSILQQVIVRGTGTAASIGQPAAGKTGTAQNFDNAWFVGYTPTLATAVWVGYMNSNKPLLNVEGVPQVSGGTLPARVWSRYMQVALDTSAPTIALAGGAKAGLPDGVKTNQRVPQYQGTAADDTGNVVAVQASIDGGAFAPAGVTCTGCGGRSVTWSFKPPAPLADGAHTLTIEAVDIAGRDSTVLTRHLTVDTVAPKAAAVAAQGAGTTLGFTFSKPMLCSTLQPGDFSAVVGVRFSAVTAVGCAGTAAQGVSLTVVLPPRGGDRVAVTVLSPYSGGPSDEAGNALTGDRTVTAAAANVAPGLGVSGGTAPAALTANAQPAYQGTAADPDGTVAGIQASVDGGPFSSAGVSCPGCGYAGGLAAPVSWTWRPPARLADGAHTLAWQSVDNAGASSPAASETVTIDTVPPKPTAVSATGGAGAVTMTFSKALACSSLQPSGFSVLVGAHVDPVASIACDGSSATGITLALTVPPRGGDAVAVTLAEPYSGGPTDVPGNHFGTDRSISAPASNAAPALALAGGPGAAAPTNQARPAYQGSATDPDGTVAGIQASVDGGPFSAAGVSCPGCGANRGLAAPVSWTWASPLRLADGSHLVAFQSTDNAGTASAPISQTVSIDTVPPAPAGLAATGGQAALAMTFSKPLACSSLQPSGFSVMVGGRYDAVASVSCAGPSNATVALTLASPPRGGDPVAVTVLSGGPTDVPGNHFTAAHTIGATATNVGPSVSMTAGAPDGGLTDQARPSYQGSATDPDGTVASVQASVDGAPYSRAGIGCTACGPAGALGAPEQWTWQSPLRLADGAHTVAFQSVDNAGTASAAVTETLTVDTVAPKPAALTAVGGSVSMTATFSKPLACSSLQAGQFSITAGPNRSVVVESLACPGASSASVALTLDAAPRGGDQVVVTIASGPAGAAGPTDAAGNPVATPRLVATAADQAPTLQLALAPGTTTSSPRPTFTGSATDPDGGVAGIRASLDGGPFTAGGVSCPVCSPTAPVGQPVSWSYQAPGLPDGPHTVALEAVDTGGATSPVATQTLVVNSQPPAVQRILASGESSVVAVLLSKPVSCSSVNLGEFSVTAGGSPVDVALATCTGTADAVVDLVLASAPAPGAEVAVTVSRGILDDAGNRLVLPAAPLTAPATTPASDLP